MIESPLPGADVKPGMQDLSDVASLVEIKEEATVSEWRRLLHSFYEPFPVVKHYEQVHSA
jgi:hypothetical protein